MSEPKAMTSDDLRDTLLRKIAHLAVYWAAQEGDKLHVLNGLAFSILAELDGDGMDLPAIELVARPHPEDRDFLKGEGQDWIEDGTIINESGPLHELWRHFEVPGARP